MLRQNLCGALFLSLFVLAFAVSPEVNADDKSDAWENVSKMIRFIEMGDASSVDLAGNRAVASLEKAIDNESDSGKKDKLRDAIGAVREALGHASKGEWPYADGAAKRALKKIEEAR